MKVWWNGHKGLRDKKMSGCITIFYCFEDKPKSYGLAAVANPEWPWSNDIHWNLHCYFGAGCIISNSLLTVQPASPHALQRKTAPLWQHRRRVEMLRVVLSINYSSIKSAEVDSHGGLPLLWNRLLAFSQALACQPESRSSIRNEMRGKDLRGGGGR